MSSAQSPPSPPRDLHQEECSAGERWFAHARGIRANADTHTVTLTHTHKHAHRHHCHPPSAVCAVDGLASRVSPHPRLNAVRIGFFSFFVFRLNFDFPCFPCPYSLFLSSCTVLSACGVRAPGLLYPSLCLSRPSCHVLHALRLFAFFFPLFLVPLFDGPSSTALPPSWYVCPCLSVRVGGSPCAHVCLTGWPSLLFVVLWCVGMCMCVC